MLEVLDPASAHRPAQPRRNWPLTLVGGLPDARSDHGEGPAMNVCWNLIPRVWSSFPAAVGRRFFDRRTGRGGTFCWGSLEPLARNRASNNSFIRRFYFPMLVGL